LSALLLAAAILACSAAAAVAPERLAAEHLFTVGSPDELLASMRFTLPTLLASAAWRDSAAAAPLLLQRLVAALHAVEAAQQAAGQSAGLDVRSLLRACLLGARAWLPHDMWEQLAGLL
jgi:hypothetical protein